MRRCVFFDRDGIVNESPGPGYVERWEDFRLIPEFVDVLKLVRDRGYSAVIATNQRGVALGLMSQHDVDTIHANLRRVLRESHGVDVLDIYTCPHEKGVCDCRKPQPGMLREAARKHNLDLAASWMVGDGERDIEAGKAAGCRTVLVTAEGHPTLADYRVRSMAELAGLLERVL